MPCYLCAYQSPHRPFSREQLPADSPAPSSLYGLGTCSRCSVLACSEHGTRYGAFECAICQPALATEVALGVSDPPAGAAMFEVSRQIGERASEEQLIAVEQPL